MHRERTRSKSLGNFSPFGCASCGIFWLFTCNQQDGCRRFVLSIHTTMLSPLGPEEAFGVYKEIDSLSLMLWPVLSYSFVEVQDNHFLIMPNSRSQSVICSSPTANSTEVRGLSITITEGLFLHLIRPCKGNGCVYLCVPRLVRIIVICFCCSFFTYPVLTIYLIHFNASGSSIFGLWSSCSYSN